MRQIPSTVQFRKLRRRKRVAAEFNPNEVSSST
jgi:hypothetical protein